jgi:hypothetical protein
MEREWLVQHKKEYRGALVALEGSQLVASGAPLKEALEDPRKNGYDLPLVHHVPKYTESELPFGGW